MKFVDEFEKNFCTNQQQLKRLRNDPSYEKWFARWQTNFYFKLKSDEIANDLEEKLKTAVDNISSEMEKQGEVFFKHTQFALESFRLCWDESVWLFPLNSNFTKLSIIIIQRFISWASVPVAKFSNSNSVSQQSLWTKVTRDTLLLLFHDLNYFHLKVSLYFRKILFILHVLFFFEKFER